jgi:hypothetical protein
MSGSYEAPKKFTQSVHQEERSEARRGIAKGFKTGVFNRLERDLITMLANLWFHHRGENGEGVIRPGREYLAKRAKCSIRSVASLLKRLREAGILIPIEYLKGGRKATRYKLDMHRLLVWCGVQFPEVVQGALKLLKRPLQLLRVFLQPGKNRAIRAYGYNKRRSLKLIQHQNGHEPPKHLHPSEVF